MDKITQCQEEKDTQDALPKALDADLSLHPTPAPKAWPMQQVAAACQIMLLVPHNLQLTVERC